MPTDKEKRISAHVMMRPADGKRLPADAVITAETLAEFTPAEADVAAARAWFEKAGFVVGVLHGLSFSIEAELRFFEKTFEQDLVEAKSGAVSRAVEEGAKEQAAEVIPIDSLPDAIAKKLEAVTFSAPLDFGPADSFF